jgi:hypothetical protein
LISKGSDKIDSDNPKGAKEPRCKTEALLFVGEVLRYLFDFSTGFGHSTFTRV